jgi:hypothetical protein
MAELVTIAERPNNCFSRAKARQAQMRPKPRGLERRLEALLCLPLSLIPMLRLDSLAATTRADWGSAGRSRLRLQDTFVSPKRAERTDWGRERRRALTASRELL